MNLMGLFRSPQNELEKGGTEKTGSVFSWGFFCEKTMAIAFSPERGTSK